MHTILKDTQIFFFYYVWRQGKSGQKQNAGTTGKRPGQGKGLIVTLLNPISPWHTQNLYQDLELNFANLAQLTQALPPGTLFAVGLESHSKLTCQARQ